MRPNGEDISGNEDTISSPGYISSPENGENRAQNGASEGSEGSEDIYRTFTGPTSTTPITPSGPSPIYRLGQTDTFACHNCKKQGDKWFMEDHECSGKGREVK
jgi:hypothetical protein